MGLEIRHKVVEYVAGQIASLEEKNPGKYTNVGVVNTNAMKYIANFFQKGQVCLLNLKSIIVNIHFNYLYFILFLIIFTLTKFYS